MRQYNNYAYTRLLNGIWIADPINSLTTEERLRANSGPALKAMIDDAVSKLTPNPWELPSAAQVEVMQAA